MEGAEGLGAFAVLCVGSILAITNPLNTAPLYLALTRGYTAEHQRHNLRLAIITGLLVLISFALIGTMIFGFFGITMNAFRIAGGIIIFGVGADMLRGGGARGKTTREEEEEGMRKDEVGITPLGVPMIVGPGAITTVMVLSAEAQNVLRMLVLIGAILFALGSIYATLSVAPRLVKALGQTGLNIGTRIMGLLLMVMAVQFIVDGAQPILIDIIAQATGGRG